MNNQMKNLSIGNRGGYGGARGGGYNGRGGNYGNQGGRGGFRGGPPTARPLVENPKIVVNSVKMDVRPNMAIYKYDVKIVLSNERFTKEITADRHESARHRCVALVSHAFSLWGRNLPVYNRASALYSLDAKLAGNVTFEGNEVPSADVGDAKVTVTLTEAESFQASTNDLRACVNIRPNHQPNLLEFLNIVIERQAYARPDLWFSENGTHYLLQDSDKEKPLGYGMLLKPGAKTSAKCYGNSMEQLQLALSVDIKSGVFHNAENLAAKYEKCRHLGPIGINNIFKGLSVSTTYGERKQIFSIQRVQSKASEVTVHIEGKDGQPAKDMSLLEFFRVKKNIQLRYPDLPLVWRRRGDQWSQFPMELLEVLPNQSVRVEKMGGEVQDAVIKFSAMAPEVRQGMCRDYMKKLGLTSSNQSLVNFGLKIHDEFMTVVGRTLHAVRVHQGTMPNNNVSLSLGNAPQAQIKNWAIINMTNNAETYGKFVKFMKQQLDKRGIRYEPPTERTLNKTPKEIMELAKQNRWQYVLIILPDRNLSHDEFKYYEMKEQVVTQIVKESVARKCGEQMQGMTMDNILMKMVLKNGGYPYDVETTEGVLKIATNDTMYMGIEFSHQQPSSGMDMSANRSSKLPSRVGFAATCGDNPKKIHGDYLFLEAHNNEAVYPKMGEITKRCVDAFARNRKAFPKNIVLYVTGFSEGQFHTAKEAMKIAVKKGLEATGAKGARLILLAVSKTHMERFYRDKIEGNNAREKNVSAGLLIEKDVVSPAIGEYFEFFLHPHTVLQGTGKTPKYAVLVNEAKIDRLSIQQATHALTFLHSVCTSAVSVPAVLTVADRCAERGQTILRFHMRLSGRNEIAVDEANQELTYFPNNFWSRFRFNA